MHAQVIDQAKANKVKATYLYNFARFIQWPRDAFRDDKAPFVIGILGNDPFGRILDDTMKAKTVAGRPIRVRRFRWDREAHRTALRTCHLLYVSRSERRRVGDIVSALHGVPMLLVSDMDGFTGREGMIGLVLENGRIVFEINRSALERVRLRASSKLLALARIVESKTRVTQRKDAPGP